MLFGVANDERKKTLMKVVKKKGEAGHVLLDATATPQEVANALAQASMAFCAQMNLRPQPGKSQAQVAQEQLGIADLDKVVAPQAIEMLVPLALDKHDIAPAFMPEAQPASAFGRGHAFQFKLDVMVKPRFELSDYGPVQLTVRPYSTDESLVDKQLDELAKKFVTYVADDPRPLRADDYCLLKMAVSKGGVPVENLTADSRPMALGKNYMPPEFEAGVVGMNVGETRTFTFEAPDFDENMNEVAETFEATVTLLEVQKEAPPAIDDAWVAKNMPLNKDLAGLRAEIRKNLDAEGMRRYDDHLRTMAADKLAKRFEGSIPDAVYESTMRDMQTQLRHRVQQQGTTWEKFVEQQGGEQQLGMMMMLEARQQVLRGYSLDAYYHHEGLSFTDEDMNEVCFAMNPRDPRATRERMEKSGMGYALRESAERLRACKHLVEQAEITYE